MYFIVKTVKEILSSKGLILFFLMLCLFVFLYVRDVNAYSAGDKSTFPNLSYQYNRLDDILKTKPEYAEAFKTLIERLDKTGYNYLIYIDSFWASESRFALKVALSKEAFSLTLNTNKELRYTKRVVTIGNASSYMKSDENVPDSYCLGQCGNDNFTKEKVDPWISTFEANSEVMFEKATGTLAFDSSYGTWSYAVIIHSNMDMKFENYPEDYAAISINNVSYVNGNIPTFNKAFPDYKIYEDLPPDFDYKDMPDISTDGEDQEFDTNDPDKVIEGNDSKKSMLNLLSFLLDQFPIYKQMRTISERWRYYDSDCIMLGNMNEPYIKRCLELPNLKFTFLDYEYNISGLDVTWYLQYRNMIDFFIKLSIGLLTVFKCLHIVQGMFHGK